jgi:tetratricopeptide (TPR) repeat protein
LEAAQAEFEEARSLNQRKEKAAEAVRLSNQGLDLAAKGDFQGAARSLREATDANPDFVLAHYNLGLVLADSGDLKNATVELRTAIYLRPGTARSYYELGRALERAGDRNAAISALERAAELDPADTRAVESLRTLGVQWTVGRERRSKAQNVNAGPFTARGLDELGMSLSRKGNLPGAIALFLRALSLEPDYYPARRDLASAYMERGAYHEACLEFRKALMLRSDDAQVHFQFGLCLEKNGDTGAAIEQFRMVQRTQPDFAQAQEQLKVLLRKESIH